MSGAGKRAVFAPEGALTMQTVPAVLEQAQQAAAQGDLLIDFSALTAADSAALALVLACVRTSRAAGHTLALAPLPDGLGSLAQLYDIAALLPTEVQA